jgi:TonB family protein
MASHHVLNCGQKLRGFLSGLVFASSVLHAETSPQQAVAPAGECEAPTRDPHPTLISEMRVPTPSVDAVSPPRLLYAVNPDFPTVFSDQSFSGNSVVALVVDVNGRPQQIHVTHSPGAAFDENAIKAASQFRFEPARLKNQAVPAKVCVEIVFKR